MARFSILVLCTILALVSGSVSEVKDREVHVSHRLDGKHWPHLPHRPHGPHCPCHKTSTSAPPTTAPTSRPPHCPPWPLPCHKPTTSAPPTSIAPTSRPPHCPPWSLSCHKPTTPAPTSRPPHCPPWPLPCHRTTTAAPSTSTNLPTESSTSTSTSVITSTAAPSTSTNLPTESSTSTSTSVITSTAAPSTSTTESSTSTSTSVITSTAAPSTSTTESSTSTSTSVITSTSENPSTDIPVDKSHDWVLRDAGTLPSGCNFIYGGRAHDRLLYVGRVNVSNQLVPAAIHHYSAAGNEYYTAIGNEEVVVGRENVEWLCSPYGVAWVRVKEFSDEVLRSLNPIVIGRNSDSGAPTYACLSHSFYDNLYPPSVGQVVGNSCQFVVGNEIVDTRNFKWWHTLELLVSLQGCNNGFELGLMDKNRL